MGPETLFYLFAGAMVIFSVLVVSLRNLLHAALSLIASFGVTAGMYILLHAEFVAVAQVMVYIGGIVIFIVFAILLTTKLGEIHLPAGKGTRIYGALIGAILFGVLVSFFTGGVSSEGALLNKEAGSLMDVGIRLLSIGQDGFIVPFEIISVLLLTVVIAAITVARSATVEKEKGGEES